MCHRRQRHPYPVFHDHQPFPVGARVLIHYKVQGITIYLYMVGATLVRSTGIQPIIIAKSDDIPLHFEGRQQNCRAGGGGNKGGVVCEPERNGIVDRLIVGLPGCIADGLRGGGDDRGHEAGEDQEMGESGHTVFMPLSCPAMEINIHPLSLCFMDPIKEKLLDAEHKAEMLFSTAEQRKLIVPGKSERQLNPELFALARELYGIEKYWHKRIVRAGANTLQPYAENPPDLLIQENDILFFDFGPVFEDWEADLGRTYVLGNDPLKLKLKKDIEDAWQEGKEWFHTQSSITGAEYYQYITELAHRYGWAYGSPIAGHLIGHFPHERLEPGSHELYVHPENHNDMFLPDAAGNKRHWILEIHFVDTPNQIGGFFEQLLT